MYADDLDTPTSHATILTSLLVAVLADALVPEWLLICVMSPYFVVFCIGLVAWSATVSRDLIGDHMRIGDV
jgi:hypothetical protein